MPRPRLAPFALAAVVATATLTLAVIPAPSIAALPPIIPRSVLFSPPERTDPRISPDGTRLAYLARSPHGVMLLWVRTLATGDSLAITKEGQPEVQGAEWAPDGKRLLFLRDGDGDENWHVFAVDIESHEVKDLTPFAGVRAELVAVDARHPDQILVGLNQRDKTVLDVHRIDLATGEVRLDTQNPGDVTVWTPDDDLVIRAATALDPKDASTTLRVRDSATAPWRELVRWPIERSGFDRNQRILGFLSEGRELLVQSPIGASTTRLVAIELASGREREVLAANPRADLWNLGEFVGPENKVVVMRDPKTGAIQAAAIDAAKPEWTHIDPSVAADFRALAAAHRGVFTVDSRDAADRKWIVSYWVDDGPVSYVLYDRTTKRPRTLFQDRPRLARLALAPMKPITVRSADGLTIPCYLTLPVGVPAHALPMVVYIHGGPWFRDEWGYEPDVQLLANRGYAVLQVNFRGSTGFGLAWLNAGNHEFGPGKVMHDVTDAVDWVVSQGIADRKRVGVMGASFGGYATLCALAFFPDRFACGVDIVGPSDLRTLFQSFPPYWAARLQRWKTRMGDVIASDSLNQALSPLYHVEQIRAPLLVGHGANDPRAKLFAAETMVKTLRARGADVDFVVYVNEGHGFAKPENQQDFSRRMEEFLHRHLGGRMEAASEVAGDVKAAVEVR